MIFRNTTIFWVVLASLVCFIPFAYFPERTDAFEVMNAMLGAFGIFTFISVAKKAWNVLKLPAHNIRASHVLIIAIALGSVCLGVSFITLWIWRAFPHLDWVISTWWTLLTRWELLLAFCFVLSTSFNDAGVITASGWKRTLTLCAGAAILATILVVIGATRGN